MDSDKNPPSCSTSATTDDEQVKKVRFFDEGLNLGALELYKIEAINITPDRKFKEINFVSCGTHIIYKRGKKDDIPIKKPLLLCGPAISHSGLAYIDIQIGSFEWSWRLFVGEEVCPSDLPIVVDIKDRTTGSCVKAYIEHITKAAQALIKFSFEDDENVGTSISITKATITATTVVVGECQNKNKSRYDHLRPDDKFWEPILAERPPRVLLSVCNSSIQHLTAGENIQLNRSVIALPLKSTLRVAVDMTYIVGGTKRIRRIKDTINLNVPEKPCKADHIWFDHQGAKYPKLKMELLWENDYTLYIGKKNR